MSDITATTAANQLNDYLRTYIERQILQQFRREPTLPMFAVDDYSGRIAPNEFKVRVPDMSATTVSVVDWAKVDAKAALANGDYGLPAAFPAARGVQLGYIDMEIDQSVQVAPLELDTRFLDYNPVAAVVDDWAMKVGWGMRDKMNQVALNELQGIVDTTLVTASTTPGNKFGDNIVVADAAAFDTAANRLAIVKRLGRLQQYMVRWQFPGMHWVGVPDVVADQIGEWLRFPTDEARYGTGITQDRQLTNGNGPDLYNLWGLYVVPLKDLTDGVDGGDRGDGDHIASGTGALTDAARCYAGCTGAPPLFYGMKPPYTKTYAIPGRDGIGMGYWRGEYFGYESSAKRFMLHFAFNRTQ